ncbi:bacterial low temperature requirement A protein-domain-containing protein [Blyttiomyces helicus]|uniref:Bacterial low temperature requirement A protein-domain-containing protein n=1 Tax=Blyttiomyces helicus TaxID=388810 RepID=A0A4P9WA87_9FUNG|nr:bacterial low temperature requirement A protein-domain-containing protein [Blyttiomyces helicus]|eukprot:RKO89499.1 bacterial low temperature requirement A protein-domain-containing protein [Blyttiomyces helicus]
MDEFGALEDIKIHEPSKEHAHKLLCSGKPRQYFVDDVLHRESKARKTTWDELFLDLVFVAAINRVGTILKTNDVDGALVNQFAITFIPPNPPDLPPSRPPQIWKAWQTIQAYTNRFGSSDFLSKLMLWLHTLLIAALGITSENVYTSPDSENTSRLFAGTVVAIGVLDIVAHARVLVFYPEFTGSMIMFMVGHMFERAPFAISMAVDEKWHTMLWWLAIGLDYFGRVVLLLFYRYVYHPKIAVNIEHAAERLGLLTLIMLGEVVVSILWDSTDEQISKGYIATMLGLIIAISFQWLYYNVDGSFFYTHALRRSVLHGIIWSQLHLPLHICVIAGGAALYVLIQLTADPTASPSALIRWLFLGGFGIAMFILALIGLTHRGFEGSLTPTPVPGTSAATLSDDQHPEADEATSGRPALLKKRVRLATRAGVASILCIMAGTVTEASPLTIVGVTAALCMGQTLLEEWGRLLKAKRASVRRGRRPRPPNACRLAPPATITTPAALWDVYYVRRGRSASRRRKAAGAGMTDKHGLPK